MALDRHTSEIHKVDLSHPACMGAAGGKATTAAKREASRLNGAKGGRPRKVRKEALP
jgi:hypothetical protein